jgi:hypothetical protein
MVALLKGSSGVVGSIPEDTGSMVARLRLVGGRDAVVDRRFGGVQVQAQAQAQCVGALLDARRRQRGENAKRYTKTKQLKR